MGTIDDSATANTGQLNSSRNLPELDGLRGFAVLLVVIWHYVVSRWEIPDSSGLSQSVVSSFRLAWSGVDLFFVLSGFLIAGILIDNRDSASYFWTFYRRRICRIFPLYFLLVAIFALGVGANEAGMSLRGIWLFRGAGPLWTYVTFTQNIWMAAVGSWGARFNSVTWSLAIEEQFYLVLPLVVRLVAPRRLVWVLSALVIVSVLFRIWVFSAFEHGGLACYFLPFGRMDALGLGALAAYGLRKPRVWSALRSARTVQVLVLLVLFAGVVGMTWAGFRIRSWEMSSWGFTWLAVFYLSIMLLALTQSDSLIARAARLAPLRYLGTISFGVYLLHQIVDRVVFTYLLNQPGVLRQWSHLPLAGITFLLTLLLAYLSWRFFESPILRRAKALGYAPAPITVRAKATTGS